MSVLKAAGVFLQILSRNTQQSFVTFSSYRVTGERRLVVGTVYLPKATSTFRESVKKEILPLPCFTIEKRLLLLHIIDHF